jgi:tetratricopeptide (TPR) repeat protein
MGTVFMAEQTQPVQRKVALKIIKPGMDSQQVIARFEAERQALALMDHPNIAKVLDAGTTGGEPGGISSGKPYFVMELVKGVPITRYCDEHHLTPKQRLELFVPVCQAVQHAHQKGIIHRDLKPSNVLVAEYDDKPVAKVIDFGVAKATGPKLTERTMFTELGQIVGTLEYMSPEQAKLNALDIDTRSDIYALGVLLYELLTGTTPFEKKRLQQAAFDEILRIIREEEPPRPSTRLSTTEGLPSIAANRGLEPKKLSGLVRGELDWIVMKALEKDRNRRYETANGLARDLERYLADEPVQAGPPSAGYRLRKFVQRNRRALVMTCVVVVAVIAGVTALVGSALWTARQRDAQRAETERAVMSAVTQTETLLAEGDKVSENPQRWQAVLQLAQRSLERGERLVAANEVSAGLLEHIRRARTSLDRARKDARFMAALEQAAVLPYVGLGKTFGYEAAHLAYAQALREHGLDTQGGEPEAIAMRIQRSHRSVQKAVLACLDGWAIWEKDKALRSRLLRIAVLADNDAWSNRLRKAWGAGDVPTIKQLAKEARRNSLSARQFVLMAFALSAWVGRAEAATWLRDARRHHPADFEIVYHLGNHLHDYDHPDAATLDESAGCFWATAALRPESPAVQVNLGNRLKEKGDKDGALACYQRAISLNPDFAPGYLQIGFLFGEKGERDTAIEWYQKALARDPKSAHAHFNIGANLYNKGDLDAAISWYHKALALKPNWKNTIIGALARCHEKRGDHVALSATAEQLARVGGDDDRKRAASFLAAAITLARKDKKLTKTEIAAAIQASRVRLEAIHVREITLLEKRANEAPDNPDLRRGLVGDGYWRHTVTFRDAGLAELAVKALNKHGKLVDKLAADFPRNIQYRTDVGNNRLEMGLLLEGAGRLREAEEMYDRMVEIGEKLMLDFPEPRSRYELATWYSVRGGYYSRRGEYRKAVAGEAKVLELLPDNVYAHCFNIPVNLLLAGDTDGYRQACAGALKRFGDGTDRFAVHMLVRACGLAPDAVADPQAVVQAMTKVVSADRIQVHLFALGMAHYRAGQWDQAIARFNESIKLDPAWHDTTVQNGLGLALAHYRRGDIEIARQWLKKSVDRLDQGEREKGLAVLFPPHFVDWYTCRILRAEAEALIGKTATSK